MKKATKVIDTSTPTTMSALLERTRRVQWAGKGCEAMFVSNVKQAISIIGESLDVSTDTLDQLKMVLTAQGLKPATVNQKLINLHTVLAFGFERGWVQKLPKMHPNQLRNIRTRVMTRDEEAELLEWLRENGHREAADFIELLTLTGCRRGELKGAHKKDIVTNPSGTFLVLEKTKTGVGRSVPLTVRAQEIASARVPFKLADHTLHRAFKAAKAACGFGDDLVLHSMRHTAATRLLHKTKNIVTVQKMLGHADIAMTTRYAHMTDADLFNAVTGE